MKRYNLKVNNEPKKEKNEQPDSAKVGKYERIIKPNTDLFKFGDVFAVDITEAFFGAKNETKYYICGYKNLKTKQIFGLIADPHKGVELVLKSLELAIEQFGVIQKN